MKFLKQSDGRPTLTMCTCGKVRFHYGSTTLNFEAEKFASFAGAVAHLFANTSTLTAIDGLARSHQCMIISATNPGACP